MVVRGWVRLAVVVGCLHLTVVVAGFGIRGKESPG